MKSNAVTIAVITLCLVFSGTAYTQVGINLTGAPPHSSSILDVSGNTGGFLAPRMTLTERLNIPSPAEGLIVYQTNFEGGYYYFNGFSWTLFSEPPYISPWTVFGDTVFRILGPDTIMTISEDFVGIGVTNPTVMLDVAEEIRAMNGVRYGYINSTIDNLIWSNQYGLELDNFQTTDIRFMTSESPGTAHLRMSIKPNGNIGINRDDPDKKLCVEGGVRIGSGIDQASRDANMLYIGDLQYVRIGEWNGDDKMSFWASSFSFENGYVGIGEITPQRSLHVNDVIRLEPRATAPSPSSMGDMYVRSSDGKLMVYDGSVWQACW